MKTLVSAIIIMLGFTAVGKAQSQSSTLPDVASVQANDPNVVLEDWRQWHVEPTEQNAYVGEFMKAYEVPQKGMKNLSREETWYWWISHHNEEIETYFEMKQEAVK